MPDPSDIREGPNRARTTVVPPSFDDSLFRHVFESSSDAITILDPETGAFIECNAAAVRLTGGATREWLLARPVAGLAPEFQPDGTRSVERAQALIAQALREGSLRFEWLSRDFSGRPLPLDVSLNRVMAGERPLLVTISRDMSARQRVEEEMRRAHRQLEKRMAERTEQLRASEDRWRVLVERAGEDRREKVQQATFQISEAVLAADDLSSLYRRIHSIVKSLMPAENFYIAVLDRETEIVSFPYYVDESSSTPPPPRQLTTGLTGYVIRTGKPFLVDRQMSAHKKQVGDGVVLEGATTLAYTEYGTDAAIWLGVPLGGPGRVFGVMAIQDYRDDKAYGEAEKQILTFVGEQVAQAIERKRAEERLRESEVKHRALFEATSQGVMLHDEETILEVNPAVLDILGYATAAEIIGRHLAELSAPIQPGGETAAVLAPKHIQDCMTKGRTRFEWLSQNNQGHQVPLEVLLTRIPMGGREVIQAVINDISERKKAEAELRRSLQRERELSQLKSDFVSMVSHEFRTPLGIIMSSAEILEDYYDRLEAEDRNQHLVSIQKNSRRMADVMEDVLLVGRFEAGKVECQPGSIDLASFCRRLADEVHSATNRMCPIEVTVSPHLPAAWADERLLRHIFTNLLTNAVKYSTPGTPVFWVIDREGANAVSGVRDRGIGIPTPEQAGLFEAFRRGSNVGQRPGTGLGLVVVKRCVDLHGGSVEVVSRVGEGTKFTVRLPIFPAEAKMARASRKAEKGG